MRFPDNLLATDEQVVLHMHPHWKELIGPVVSFVIFTAVAVVALFMMPDSWGAWVPYGSVVIALLAIFLLLWLAVLPWINWSMTHYVFTTHRVLLRTGVITRKGRDIPFTRVNDVSFEQTVFQRMLGLGTLMIQSASEQGAVVFSDMPRVEMVQSTLYKLVDEDRNRRSTAEEVGGGT